VGGRPAIANDSHGLRSVLCRVVHGFYGYVFRHCEYADDCTPGIEIDPVHGEVNVSCYPIWRDCSKSRLLDDGTPCNSASDSQIDACIRRHPGGRPLESTYGSNCQSDTIETISYCCMKTSWQPNWYAGSRGEYVRWDLRRIPGGYVRECVEWSSGICRGRPSR
jgi:hypothetical protein